MLIEDGQGSGVTAGVTSSNRLKTVSISATPEHFANHNKGLSYNFLFQETPEYTNPSTTSEGGICFLYLKNTSEKDLILEGLDIRLGGTSQVEIIEIVENDGEVPVGGNSRTPVNLNLSSGKVAEGVFLSSSNISSMGKGSPMLRYYIESSHTTKQFNFEQDLIVPQNNTITLWAEYGGTEIDGTLVFYYADVETG